MKMYWRRERKSLFTFAISFTYLKLLVYHARIFLLSLSLILAIWYLLAFRVFLGMYFWQCKINESFVLDFSVI